MDGNSSLKHSASVPDLRKIPARNSEASISEMLKSVSNGSKANPQINKLFEKKSANDSKAPFEMFRKPLPPDSNRNSSLSCSSPANFSTATPETSPVCNNTRLGVKAKLLGFNKLSPRDLASIPGKLASYSGNKVEILRKAESLIKSKSRANDRSEKTTKRKHKISTNYMKKHFAGLTSESSQDCNLTVSHDLNGSSKPASPPPSKNQVLQISEEKSDDFTVTAEFFVPDSQSSGTMLPGVAEKKTPMISTASSAVPESQEHKEKSKKKQPSKFSSICRNGRNFFVLLPVLSHPTCPEKGCDHVFATDRLNNLCSAVDLHFREKHQVKKIVIKKLCDYCDKEIENDPRTHSCFEKFSYYNINYNDYSFQHKCPKCNFSCWEEKWMHRHKCKYSRKMKKIPEAQSIEFELSPMANLSPVSSHAHNPVTDQQPVHKTKPSNSTTLNPDVTDPQPSTSFANVQLPIQAPASSPEFQSVDPSPSGLNGSPAHARAFSPTPHLYPGTLCRTDGEIHIVLPMNDFFRCTEPGCSKTIYGGDYSSVKGTFLKHLSKRHERVGLTTVTWCSFCKKKIEEPKLSLHECLIGVCYYNIDYDILPFNNKCHLCSFNTDTKKGLSNHLNYHKRKDVRARKRQDFATAQRALSPDNSPPSSPTSIPPPSPSSSTDSMVPPTPGSELLSNPTLQSQVSIPPDSQLPQQESNDTTTDDGLGHVLREIAETPNPDDPSPSAEFCQKFKDILTSDSSSRWEEFNTLLSEYIEFVKRRVKIPENTAPRTFRKSNPKNKTFIQKLYKRNRRRAVRLILGQSQCGCDLEPEDLATHFFPDTSFTPDPSIFEKISAAESEVDLSKFSPEEVWAKLSKAENTAPGPDRLTFQHWKSSDPEAKTLACIFNICLKYKKCPDQWKESKTVFIPKNESGDSLSDWRPISLCSTISKLFSSCVAKRLIKWIIDNNILSSAQKGFMPYDGAFENNFLLQAKINEARRKNSTICIASIDISNAFGSVPHEAIKKVLQLSGAGQCLCDILSDLIDNALTSICTGAGISEPRRIKRGVRQGDPISGILFNIAIEPLIRIINSLTDKLNILAFADDIILLAESIEELEVYLYELSVACEKLGLNINPKKCFTMHLAPSPRGCQPTTFKIGDESIPVLLDADEKKFLGKPIGFQTVSDYTDLNSFKESAISILESSLSYWQKIDALKAFIYPSFSYAQRTAQANKTTWSMLDRDLRPLIKKTLCIPERAANEYLYGNQKDGLFGIPIASEDSDIAHIDAAFKLLSSRDPHTKEFAWNEFRTVVAATMPNPTSFHHFSDYLSNAPLERPSGMPASVWSRARKASGNLKVEWEFHEDLKFSIFYKDSTITDRSRVFHTLRNLFKSDRSLALREKPHQGKTAACISKAKASSHFNSNGKFIRFTDWRFVHRARLGLVDVNGYKRDVPINEKHCRRCKDDIGGPHVETLPHIINNCKRNMSKITERHNEFLAHVKKAALARNWKIYSENRAIAGSSLRPDLVISKESSVIIIDAAVTFENGDGAFDRIRKIKNDKYAKIAKELKNSFTDVSIAPLIVGSLGSWDPKNDKHLLRLCSKKYLNLMRKLVVSDTIRFSRDIFTEHTWGIKQVQPTKYYPRRQADSNQQHSTSTNQADNTDPSPVSLSSAHGVIHDATNAENRELSSNMLPESQNSASGELMQQSELSLTMLPESHSSAHCAVIEVQSELSSNMLPESQTMKIVNAESTLL